VVFVSRDPTGHRAVTEITAIPGRCEDGVIEVETIFRTQRGELVRAEGFPPHVERFERVGVDIAALLTERQRAFTPAASNGHEVVH
jgi:pilus assembly protein CpaF